MADVFDLERNSTDRTLARDELAAAMARCDVLVPTVRDTIDAKLIGAASDQLKLIANFGAGTDNIDVAAAHARGILVTNTPGVFTDDTADLAIALIIIVARRFREGARTLATGQWYGWGPTDLLGQTLKGKQLGIIGMGQIGQAVAHRARGFGLQVSYHNRRRLPFEVEAALHVRYEPELSSLIAEADILTLHCPALPSDKPLMDGHQLGLMKPGALLINTGRGSLVDEEALITALADGRIGGAGLDVFHGEPKLDPRLLSLPNVVVLPHLGSATLEGRVAAGERIIANIRSWAAGDRPLDQVLPPI